MMKPYKIRISYIVFTVMIVASMTLTGCGGGGDSSSNSPSANSEVTTVGPSATTNEVTLGAYTVNGSIAGDSPITDLATVSYNATTGVVSITNGKGVRGYELKFDVSEKSTPSVSFKDGGFIANPSNTPGTLATMTYGGSSTPQLVSANLSDSEGNDIPVRIE